MFITLCLVTLLAQPPSIGVASYYGAGRQGHLMANGKPFDYHKMTVASWDFPFGTKLRITNLANGKSLTVVVTDRGPAMHLHRIVDVSQAGAEWLDYVKQGVTRVSVEVISLGKRKVKHVR